MINLFITETVCYTYRVENGGRYDVSSSKVFLENLCEKRPCSVLQLELPNMFVFFFFYLCCYSCQLFPVIYYVDCAENQRGLCFLFVDDDIRGRSHSSSLFHLVCKSTNVFIRYANRLGNYSE